MVFTVSQGDGGREAGEEVTRSASLVRWPHRLTCREDAHGGLAFWCMHTAGPKLLLVLKRSPSLRLLLTPSLPASSRVKLVPPVLVVLKALKVLAVNLALLGPPGQLVPL